MATKLDPVIFNEFMKLPQGSKIQAEYIWLGGSMSDLRCKTRTLASKPKDASELPKWNYDGSSTNQAPGEDSEVILYPQAIYPDPFRGGDNILVICDTYTPAGEPLPTNTRCEAAKNMAAAAEHIPWFGIEQEYTLFEEDKCTPFGWPKGGYPGPQGPYYCSIGADNAFGRYIVEAHYRCCLYANVTISGVNAEVMPGQWEYQVGPCEGINSGDELWLSRYLLIRVCEAFGVNVSFDPKPIPGDWNGAGCHTNYSTEAMRNDGGYEHIIAAIEKLGKKHEEHVAVYGSGNERRLTGSHETCSILEFKYGVANRGASIRIPRSAEADQKGYFEDRRPASNMDPYVVTSKIIKTTLLE